jgi:putative transposase
VTGSVHNRYIVKNLLGQDFAAQGTHKKWDTETMYIPTLEGWLYLVTILDIFTHRVVGWSMGIHHDAQLTLAAFDDGLAAPPPSYGRNPAL